jgi:hypothetical protein
MAIRTNDQVLLNGRCSLSFDEGTGVFSIAIDGTTVYTSTSLSAAELAYLDITTLGTGAASKAVVLNASGDYTYPASATIVMPSGGTETFQSGSTLDVAGTFNIGGVGMTSTAAELNKLDDSLASNLLTRGAGVDTAETYASGIFRNGTLITTRILVDLSTLIGSATDLDIIGESAAASCHWGQITAAKSGTPIGGRVTCLEVPAGGTTDIDFYSSTVSTGTQDVIITDAALGTETALVTSGGAWTSGVSKGMTALPTADDYLYIVNGAASGGTFTAGKFLIELYGLGA